MVLFENVHPFFGSNLNVEKDVTHPHGHHVGLGRSVVVVEHHHRQHHAARHHHHDAVEVGAWEYWDQGQGRILLEEDDL